MYKQCWLFAKLDFDMRFLSVPLESLLCRYVVFSDDAGHTAPYLYKQCWLFAKLDFDMRFLLVPLESLSCRYVMFSDDAGHTAPYLCV